MRSGNTRLSFNLTTLSKQNSGSVWGGAVFGTPGPALQQLWRTQPGQVDQALGAHNCFSITFLVIFPAMESSATPVADTSCFAQPWFYF